MDLKSSHFMMKKISLLLFALTTTLFSCKKDALDYHEDGDVVKLFGSNPSGVNLVIVGDGFIKEDLKIGGKFDQVSKEVVDYLFTVAPFDHFKSDFNVYLVYAESQQRGIDSSFEVDDKKTALDTKRAGSTLGAPIKNVLAYTSKAVPETKTHVRIVLVNDEKQGGSGSGFGAFATVNSITKYVVVHEVGHVFQLGDEYIQEARAHFTLTEPFPSNLDTINDVTRVKWKHFLSVDQYKDVIGVFEGGHYRTKGVYRPEYRSVMLDTSRRGRFNAPSREAITKQILRILNRPYSFEEFLEMDKKNIN